MRGGTEIGREGNEREGARERERERYVLTFDTFAMILLVKHNTGNSIRYNISFWPPSTYLEKYCLIILFHISSHISGICT